MAGPNLPTNIDATYADDPGDPSRQTHQAHHDKLHLVANLFDLGNTAASGVVPLGNGTVLVTTPLNQDVVPDTAARKAMLAAERTFLAKWDMAASYADGQVPEWDTTTGKFIPVTPAGSTFTPSLDNALPGTVINFDKAKGGYGAAAGSWPASRITARTDITIVWTGDTDPGGIAIAGDKWDRTG